MLVRKKNMIQKSFRIDQRLEGDMSLLAELTDRSQNDLVNNAIEEFLKDNEIWFLSNVLVEHYSQIFNPEQEPFEPTFELGGLTVTIKEKDYSYIVHYTWRVDGEIAEDATTEIPRLNDLKESEVKEHLRKLSEFINLKSEDVKTYLKERLDYDDLVRLPKK